VAEAWTRSAIAAAVNAWWTRTGIGVRDISTGKSSFPLSNYDNIISNEMAGELDFQSFESVRR
jgi:hypothetical protein